VLSICFPSTGETAAPRSAPSGRHQRGEKLKKGEGRYPAKHFDTHLWRVIFWPNQAAGKKNVGERLPEIIDLRARRMGGMFHPHWEDCFD